MLCRVTFACFRAMNLQVSVKHSARTCGKVLCQRKITKFICLSGVIRGSSLPLKEKQYADSLEKTKRSAALKSKGNNFVLSSEKKLDGTSENLSEIRVTKHYD